ncbi:glycoside hydrolase [Echria macrotheca]|uniref:cellulase n=1 Tax=Echria macrotheca TaxID=438768 RepID=A0AAJ0B2A4_9PEZI|nr:glycoside hydrolase [Echria macrotheca]
MRFSSVLAIVGATYLRSVYAISGKSYTGWDCCKPGCAWKSNLGKGVTGIPMVCDINNNELANGFNLDSGCKSGGKAYLCDDYSPTPVSDNTTYGFVTMAGNTNCCKCFQITWTSGAARGKTLIAQVVNNFEATDSLKSNDIVILTPGGGSGGNDGGCRSQYGTNWGDSGGGLTKGADCANLPQNLQGGCYWRFNWAKGAINTWNIDYKQISCPSRLTNISGCSA